MGICVQLGICTRRAGRLPGRKRGKAGERAERNSAVYMVGDKNFMTFLRWIYVLHLNLIQFVQDRKSSPRLSFWKMKVIIIIFPILQIRKLRLQEAKWYIEDREAERGRSETREENQVYHPEECLVAMGNLWCQGQGSGTECRRFGHRNLCRPWLMRLK